MTEQLEAKVCSGDYAAFIRQTGEGVYQIHPVRILDFAAGEGDQRFHLYVAHAQDVVDGETKELKEKGVSPEQITEDIKAVRESTRIRPLTPEAAILQIYDLLQRTKKYVALHESAYDGTRVRFLRAPCEKMDRYRGIKEELGIF